MAVNFPNIHSGEKGFVFTLEVSFSLAETPMTSLPATYFFFHPQEFVIQGRGTILKLDNKHKEHKVNNQKLDATEANVVEHFDRIFGTSEGRDI